MLDIFWYGQWDHCALEIILRTSLIKYC